MLWDMLLLENNHHWNGKSNAVLWMVASHHSLLFIFLEYKSCLFRWTTALSWPV